MLMSLGSREWKTLRAIKRSTNGRAEGRFLRRMDMTRFTRDGTYLTGLCELGLIREVDSTAPEKEDEPIPLTKVYALTELGEHAAEYGEFNMARPGDERWTPKAEPVQAEAAPPASPPSKPKRPALRGGL